MDGVGNTNVTTINEERRQFCAFVCRFESMAALLFTPFYCQKKLMLGRLLWEIAAASRTQPCLKSRVLWSASGLVLNPTRILLVELHSNY